MTFCMFFSYYSKFCCRTKKEVHICNLLSKTQLLMFDKGEGGTRTQQKIFHLKKVDWHLYYVYKEHTALEGIQVVFWIFVFLALSSVPVILIFSWSISLGLIIILKILFTLFPNMDYCQAAWLKLLALALTNLVLGLANLVNNWCNLALPDLVTNLTKPSIGFHFCQMRGVVYR